MKKFIIVLMLVVLCPIAFADYPQPVGYVNDFADVINESDEIYMNSLIVQLEKNTSAEIAVVAISSINDSDIKMYAVELFQKWGIGKKEKDNGILVLLVVDTRRIEVEVGYGLEGILPDGKVGRILDNNIEYLKQDNYSQGLVYIVNDISAVILSDGEYISDKSDSFNIDYLPFLIFLFILALNIAMAFASLRKKKCSECKVVMDQKIAGNDVIYTCPKCKKKIKEKRSTPLIVGGFPGGVGGSGGGFGGGSSGGGGGGRSF